MGEGRAKGAMGQSYRSLPGPKLHWLNTLPLLHYLSRLFRLIDPYLCQLLLYANCLFEKNGESLRRRQVTSIGDSRAPVNATWGRQTLYKVCAAIFRCNPPSSCSHNDTDIFTYLVLEKLDYLTGYKIQRFQEFRLI